MTLLLLVAGTAWAADRPASSDDTPAILASLDSGNVTILNDHAAAAIRGQGSPLYVLVKILGINALDFGGTQWTWNPLGYRYGYWGGPGWSNGGDSLDSLDASYVSSLPVADGNGGMDALFRAHDVAYASGANKLAADSLLLNGLQGLPETTGTFWGKIYTASPIGLQPNSDVQVSVLSFFNNRLFFGWHAMPYTEYSRREAVAGMQALIAGRSLLGTF